MTNMSMGTGTLVPEPIKHGYPYCSSALFHSVRVPIVLYCIQIGLLICLMALIMLLEILTCKSVSVMLLDECSSLHKLMSLLPQ